MDFKIHFYYTFKIIFMILKNTQVGDHYCFLNTLFIILFYYIILIVLV